MSGKKKSCAHLSLSRRNRVSLSPFQPNLLCSIRTASSSRQLFFETHLLGGEGPAVAPHSDDKERESTSFSQPLSFFVSRRRRIFVGVVQPIERLLSLSLACWCFSRAAAERRKAPRRPRAGGSEHLLSESAKRNASFFSSSSEKEKKAREK